MKSSPEKARGGVEYLTCRGTEIRMPSVFSEMQVRRQWNEIFSVEREKAPSRILYSVKLFFRSERDKRISLDKQKLREFVASRPALQDKLKVLQRDGK